MELTARGLLFTVTRRVISGVRHSALVFVVLLPQVLFRTLWVVQKRQRNEETDVAPFARSRAWSFAYVLEYYESLLSHRRTSLSQFRSLLLSPNCPTNTNLSREEKQIVERVYRDPNSNLRIRNMLKPKSKEAQVIFLYYAKAIRIQQ